MFTVISSSIRYKFLLAVASACLLVVIALGVALSNLASISGRFATFVEQDQATLQAFGKMYTQGLQGGQAIRNLVLDASDKKGMGNLLLYRFPFSVFSSATSED